MAHPEHHPEHPESIMRSMKEAYSLLHWLADELFYMPPIDADGLAMLQRVQYRIREAHNQRRDASIGRPTR